MTCKRCGENYPDSYNYCPICGEYKNNSDRNNNSLKNENYNDKSDYPKKSIVLGFVLGLFFGMWGLLGLLSVHSDEEKNTFLTGWLLSLLIEIILAIIICAIVLAVY